MKPEIVADLNRRRVHTKQCGECGKRAFHTPECPTMTAPEGPALTHMTPAEAHKAKTEFEEHWRLQGIGAAAFRTGRKRTPCHDPAVIPEIARKDRLFKASEILDDWLKGWDRAAFQAVPPLAQTKPN